MNIMNTDAITPLSVLKTGTAQETESNPLMDTSFEKVLAKAIEPVNDLQLQAADLDSKLAAGKLEYVHQAMVVGEKASLAFDLTVQLQSKVISAYQEIMRTQV